MPCLANPFWRLMAEIVVIGFVMSLVLVLFCGSGASCGEVGAEGFYLGP